MGFYVRKSIKAGPFRFNLSKSGIGVNAGFPGFRVGSSPRGNYVSMGRGGVYYRSSLGGGSTPKQQSVTNQIMPVAYSPNDVLLEDVTGASPITLESTGSGDVVAQLNAAAKQFRWGLLTLILVLVFGLVAPPWSLILWLPGIPLAIWLMMRDSAKRSVVLFYDVEDEHAAWFDGLVTNWPAIAQSQKLWRTVQSGRVQTLYSHKTNAGASHLVKREAQARTSGGRST